MQVLLNALRRDPAIGRTLAAHLGAKLAMFMFLPFAFRRAFVADTRAKFENFAQHLFVRPGSPHRELASRLADVRTVEADSDTLRHVHSLGSAGVGTAETHPGTVHQMMRRIAQRLVDVAVDVGMQTDHLPDRHRILLARKCQRSA